MATLHDTVLRSGYKRFQRSATKGRWAGYKYESISLTYNPSIKWVRHWGENNLNFTIYCTIEPKLNNFVRCVEVLSKEKKRKLKCYTYVFLRMYSYICDVLFVINLHYLKLFSCRDFICLLKNSNELLI